MDSIKQEINLLPNRKKSIQQDNNKKLVQWFCLSLLIFFVIGMIHRGNSSSTPPTTSSIYDLYEKTKEERPGLQSLKFVGLFKEGKHVWGLVSQSKGNIFAVKVGDRIGKNADMRRVLSIGERSMRVEEKNQIKTYYLGPK